MNTFEDYKENGLSVDGRKKINMIVSCILASCLDNKDKRKHVEFMRELEDYLRKKLKKASQDRLVDAEI